MAGFGSRGADRTLCFAASAFLIVFCLWLLPRSSSGTDIPNYTLCTPFPIHIPRTTGTYLNKTDPQHKIAMVQAKRKRLENRGLGPVGVLLGSRRRSGS